MAKTRFTIELPSPGTDDPAMITDHALGLTYCDFETEAQLIRAIDAIEEARELDPSFPVLLDVDFFALWTVAGQLLDPRHARRCVLIGTRSEPPREAPADPCCRGDVKLLPSQAP